MASLIPAGIAAAGSIVGGLTGGKGAKNAAKIQQQTTNSIIAANDKARLAITGLEQPTIDRGNSAGSLYGDFVGLGGGDASKAALGTYRDSTGYQDLVKSGLGGVTADAYARGTGESGATYKALEAKAMSLADQSAGDWLSRLSPLINAGQQGIGTVANTTMHTTDSSNVATQTAGDASGNAALIQGSAWQKALQGLFNAAGSAYGSSYGGGGGTGAPSSADVMAAARSTSASFGEPPPYGFR